MSHKLLSFWREVQKILKLKSAGSTGWQVYLVLYQVGILEIFHVKGVGSFCQTPFTLPQPLSEVWCGSSGSTWVALVLLEDDFSIY